MFRWREKCTLHDRFLVPHHYYILSEEDKASVTLAEGFGIIEHGDQTGRFIRVVMSQAMVGSGQTAGYGVPVSLSGQSFIFYGDHFDEGIDEVTFFGHDMIALSAGNISSCSTPDSPDNLLCSSLLPFIPFPFPGKQRDRCVAALPVHLIAGKISMACHFQPVPAPAEK